MSIGVVYYTEINVFCTAILMILHFHGLIGVQKETKRLLSFAVSWAIFNILADMLVNLLDEHFLNFSPFWYIVIKSIYFVSAGMMCWRWYCYVCTLCNVSFINKRHGLTITGIPALLQNLLLVINMIQGMLFTLSGNMEYTRGPMFLTLYGIDLLYIIASEVTCLYCYHKPENMDNKGRIRIAIFFPILPAIAGIVQYFHPWLPLLCVTVTFNLVLLYLIETEDQVSQDPLTRLNNRREFLNAVLKRMDNHSYPLYMAMIDVDWFKRINDVYGHIEGDKAIRRVAESLKEACSSLRKRAVICRFGGDEFAILFETKDPSEIDAVFKETDRLLKLKKEEDQVPYDISLSIGISAYTGKGQSIRALVNEADKKLYENKKKHHTERLK